MEDTYIIFPRNMIGNLALNALAIHESGLPEGEVDELIATLASNEEVLEGITDFVEEHSIGEFDFRTIMKETDLG